MISEEQKKAFCNLIKDYPVVLEGKYPFDARFPQLDGIPFDTFNSSYMTKDMIYQLLEESKQDGVIQIFAEEQDPVVEKCCEKLGLKYVVDPVQVKYQREWMKENQSNIEGVKNV